MNENMICDYCKEMKVKTEFRKNRKKCKDCERKAGREYRRSNDKAKIWATKNKSRMQELQSNWHQENKEKLNKKFVERYHSEPAFKIKKNINRRLRALISKEDSTSKYLGIDIKKVKEWLEFGFTEEMNWNNYGDYWHIDHVIPLNLFKLEDKSQQLIAFNWKNLMPLKAIDNLSKHDKLITEQVTMQMTNIILFSALNKIDSDDYILTLRNILLRGYP